MLLLLLLLLLLRVRWLENTYANCQQNRHCHLNVIVCTIMLLKARGGSRIYPEESQAVEERYGKGNPVVS